MDNKTKTKIGIYLCALLVMGVTGVVSNIDNICKAFPEVSQTQIITYIVSIPCLVVIPSNIITGKLMRIFSSKALMIAGILLWIICGSIPYFFSTMTAIFVARIFFGISLGMVTSLVNGLVMENFEDTHERNKVMGTATGFEMLGSLIFSITSGRLGDISWNLAFLIHAIGIVSLIAAVFLIPYRKPLKVTESGEKIKFQPTKMMWTVCILFFLYAVGSQALSNYISSVIADKNMGGPTESGIALAIFSFGGFVMGFFFSAFAKVTKRLTMAAGMALMGISYFVMVFGPNIYVIYLGCFLFGLSASIAIPCMFAETGNAVVLTSSAMACCIASGMENAGLSVSVYIESPFGIYMAENVGILSNNQWATLLSAGISFAAAIAAAIICLMHYKKAK